LPTTAILEARRCADLITPAPKRRKTAKDQAETTLRANVGLNTEKQKYNPTPSSTSCSASLTLGAL